MKNEYVITDGRAEIYVRHKKKKCICTISLEDLPIVNSYPGTWYGMLVDRVMYAYINHEGKLYQMHRIIMRPAKIEKVDHIDHNGLNNVRDNLRVVSNKVNIQNRRASENNKVGVRGVSWNEKDKAWHVQFQKDRRKVYHKRHRDLLEAVMDAVYMRKVIYGVPGVVVRKSIKGA